MHCGREEDQHCRNNPRFDASPHYSLGLVGTFGARDQWSALQGCGRTLGAEIALRTDVGHSVLTVVPRGARHGQDRDIVAVGDALSAGKISTGVRSAWDAGARDRAESANGAAFLLWCSLWAVLPFVAHCRRDIGAKTIESSRARTWNPSHIIAPQTADLWAPFPLHHVGAVLSRLNAGTHLCELRISPVSAFWNAAEMCCHCLFNGLACSRQAS
mmetsp:Transcript_50827/g.135653  ORF Transcript_50827/g.135653 Transcript_50827/m.135653 type:complete len:215 (+) Transcript_50827:2886-3530(+)